MGCLGMEKGKGLMLVMRRLRLKFLSMEAMVHQEDHSYFDILEMYTVPSATCGRLHVLSPSNLALHVIARRISVACSALMTATLLVAIVAVSRSLLASTATAMAIWRV